MKTDGRYLAKSGTEFGTSIQIECWALSLIFLSIMVCSCMDEPTYRWPKNPENFAWLKNRRIFLDPGHGGIGAKDQFRIGPNGITEEAVNLNVALILNDMLESAGATTMLSRERDVEVGIGERIALANHFHPDLLVSLHHNGSIRRMDNVNYASVFVWGNKEVKPSSFDFAKILQKELNKIINPTGKIISDFTVFKETGARILRETKYLCPGVIGEAGFFSHREQAEKLRQQDYLVREAQAYFQAISKFFQKRAPLPQIIFRCRKSKNGCLSHAIRNKSLEISLRIKVKSENDYLDPAKIHATLDGIRLNIKKISPSHFLFDYGNTMYPGEHRIRFQYRNKFNQSSMVFSTSFSIEVRKGDFQFLKTKGMKLINAHVANTPGGINQKSAGIKNAQSRKGKGKKSKRSAMRARTRTKEITNGLKMLLSALSLSPTDPEADVLIFHIAKGFALLGDKTNSSYYYKRLFYFYPESRLRDTIPNKDHGLDAYRHPVEFQGKRIGFGIK